MTIKSYVLGAGGIGLLVHYLIHDHCDSSLIAREHTVHRFKTEKLEISGAKQGAISVNAFSVDDFSGLKSGEVLFLATKSTNCLSAVKDIARKLEPGSVLVLCQNGIGIYDQVRELQELDANVILLRLNCWMGVERTELSKIRLAGIFKFDLSGKEKDSSVVESVGELLNKTGVRTDIGFDTRLSEWQKAIWNIAVNGICSILDVRNGEILDHPQLNRIAWDLLRESQQIAKLNGVNLEETDLEQVFKSLETTRKNFNATLQDLRAGRHHEIDYLNGAVVKCASKYDQKAPLNETIVNLINYLENVEARKEALK